MKNTKIAKWLPLIALLFTLQSCFVAKLYERPQNALPTVDLFRKEYQQVDSTNMGLIKRTDFFTDPILQAHIETALQENLDLNIALENIKASQSYYLQSSKAFLPSVSVAPAVNYTTQSQNTQFGRLIGEHMHIVQYDLTASLSWEADIWGKLTSSKRAAFADMQRTIAGQQAFQTTLISNVASLYYQLLVLDEQKKVTEHTIETRKKSLETSKALKLGGTLTEAAVKQSEALIYNAQSLLVQLNNQIEITENAFNLLLASEPKTVERGTLDGQQVITDLAIGVPYQLLSNRPDVRATEYELMRTFQMVNVAKADFYPSLRLTASSGFQSIDIDQLFSPRAIFGNVIGSLTQPLWNQRRLKTRHEVSLANQQIAYLNYRKSILNAGKEVADALSNFKSNNQIEEFKVKEYEAYRTATRYSEQLMNHGLANYLEVLRAQENELNTQINILDAKYQKLNSIVQLYRALGGGWEKTE
ncbi:efflux transporter outer membrane subunit [Sphingobacterium kyonggiense]